METIQLIVECTMDNQRERLIESVGEVKYRLPMIDSYVIEVQKSKVELLNGMNGIKAIYQSAEITAQMNVARKSINADACEKHELTGKGVTIAILDTGVSNVEDLTLPQNRILVFKDFVNGMVEAYDDNAHGTHVAGIAAGNGQSSNGKYTGIAPESNIVAVKILDKYGKGNSSDVLGGLQWVLDNKDRYGIRIINLSIGTVDIGSVDPLVRAVEAAWDRGIVVVIAAGNRGPSARTVTSPGTSRKVITAGASDDASIIW